MQLLLFGVFESLLYGIQYILLGAYTGAIINFIGSARSGSYMLKNKNKVLSMYLLPVIFCFIYIMNGIFTWDGWLSLLPTIASIIYCLAIWQDNVKVIRKISLIFQILWLIYALAVGAYVAVITEIVLIISTIIAIIKLDIIPKNNKASIDTAGVKQLHDTGKISN